MNFNSRFALAGQHAFLSPSNYHWINYTDQKLEARFYSAQAARKGTELHEFAHKAIELKIRMPRSQKTLNMYINDAIGFKMQPEQILYYSDNCFGTADTISFNKRLLRIHDLKNGITATSSHQLEVYAALFCLEYNYSPYDIDMDLRIYQNDEIRSYSPDPSIIERIMDTIIIFDARIEFLKGDNS